MSSTASPYGLRPSYHPSGVIRPEVSTIATGYATAILQFQPVKIVAGGSLEAAAAGDRFVGVFMGVEYTDTEGRRRLTNRWTASTSATDIVAYYTRDPAIIYEIQTNAAATMADVGEQFDFSTAGTGSTVTGLSSMSLDISSTAANAGLQLLAIVPGLDNAWGDTYVNVFVRISEHQLVADVAAF